MANRQNQQSVLRVRCIGTGHAAARLPSRMLEKLLHVNIKFKALANKAGR